MAARLQRSVLALQQALTDASSQLVVAKQTITQLQDKVTLGTTTVKSESFIGIDNNQPINVKRPVDQYHSYHAYDASGPTTDNLQYLQLTQNTQYPTNAAATYNSTYYQDASSSYMFGISIQMITYNSPYFYADTNKLTRREMFNLLQDLGQITSSTQFLNGQVVQSGGSTGFANFWEVFNKGFANLNDIVPSILANLLNVDPRYAVYRENGAEDVWTWGNHAVLWRLDLSSNTIISRPLINMSKAIDPSGPWLLRAASRGPIVSFGDGRFALTIQNFSQNGIIIFDKNFTPIAIKSQSSYNTISRDVAPDAKNFRQRSQLAQNVQQDQFNTCFVKKFSQRDISGISYSSVIDGSSVNVLNTDDGNACFIYVSSSSQSQYDSTETTGAGLLTGALTILGDYRWNQSRGKVIQYAYYKDGSNNWKLEPVNIFYTCPDLYQTGDKVQIESFIKDPTTQQYQPLKFLYPVYDNRDVNLIGIGTYRDASAFQDTFNGTVYRQTTFTDGSNGTLPITAGIQYLMVNIYDVSGGQAGLGDITNVGGPLNANGAKLSGKKFYQDVYGTHYLKFNDGTNDYWQQSTLGIRNSVPADASVNFYLTTAPRKYVDIATNVTYTDNGSGVFLNSGVADPNANANVRQTIMNNCLCTRYMVSPHNWDPSAVGLTLDGSGANLLADGTKTSPGCPFNDRFTAWSVGPNPQVPPFGTVSTTLSNVRTAPGARVIRPGFYFPNGHQFDATQWYYSRPYSLRWRDVKSWNGTYRVNGSGTTPNTNYGKFKDLSGALVAEYVRRCQTAQGSDPSQYDVQVITSGSSFTDLSGTEVVQNGYIVFKVKGSVLNGQALVAQINPASAINQSLTLSKIAADRLNIIGSGVYGYLSEFTDDYGRQHLLGGAGNTNSAPISDIFYPAQWAATYIGNQIQTILNGGKSELSSVISVDTLIKLGFDNVDWNVNPQPSYEGYGDTIPYNTAIIDNSGQILFDCTIRGLQKFLTIIGRYLLGLYPNTNYTGIDHLGNTINVPGDTSFGIDIRLPTADPQGNTAKWTGVQYNEAHNLYLKAIEIRGRCSNPRMDRVCSARPFVIDAKTLKLEHIIKSSLDIFEIFSTFSRDNFRLVEDATWVDTGANRDDVGGQVTCGDIYASTVSKMSSRTYLKKDLSSPTLAEIGGLKQYPSDSTRTNFALTKFTKLGSQPNPSIPDGPHTYGSTSALWEFNVFQCIQGNNHYIGKIGKKDVFLFTDSASRSSSNINPFHIVPILDGVKYNGFDEIDFINKSTDGTAYILPMTPANSYNFINNALNAPKQYRNLIAYTRDDNGNTVPIWWTLLPMYYYTDLHARAYDAPNGGQTSALGQGGKNCTIVNDVIFTSEGRALWGVDCATGEILATWNSDDFEPLEKNFRELGMGANSRVDPAHIGALSSTTNMIHFGMGFRRTGNFSAWGRHVLTMQVKQNDKVSAFPLSNIFLGSGALDIVFKPEDCAAYNNNKFILVSTFLTQDRYGKVFPNYHAADASFNMLYYSGITAFAIDATSDFALSLYNNKQDVANKIVNGGSWYQEKKVSFNSIKSSILFLYAGQIPAKSAKHTPFLFSDRQVLEAKSIRNQKMILSETLRIKNGNTYPYPDNGYYLEGSSKLRATYPTVTSTLNSNQGGYDTKAVGAGLSAGGYNPLNTMVYNNYKYVTVDASGMAMNTTLSDVTAYNPSFNMFNWSASAPANSQIYNQPLGYTDVGTGRPFAGQSGYDQYGTPL